MTTCETFKLDMADDFDIEYSKANSIFSLMVSLAIHQAPGRIGRQNMVTAFARAIQADRSEVVKNFEMVLENEAEITQTLDAAAAARATRAVNNNSKKMEKLCRELGIS